MNKQQRKQQTKRPRNRRSNGQNMVNVQQPLFPITNRQTGIPKFQNLSNGNIIVSNREILQDITGTAVTGVIPAGNVLRIFGFSNTSGTTQYIDNTYWISKISKAYDKWRIRKLALSYQPSLAPGTTGGQLGYYFDSDPSRITAVPTIPNMSGDMRARIQHIVEPSSLVVLPNQMNRLPQYETYTATGDSTAGTIGSLNVAWDPVSLGASTIAGALTIGRVFMDYEIEFMNPSNTIAT